MVCLFCLSAVSQKHRICRLLDGNMIGISGGGAPRCCCTVSKHIISLAKNQRSAEGEGGGGGK